jgi:predicted secreted protein
MKMKKSIMIVGLVTIAAVTAGTVIGVNFSTEHQKNQQKPLIVPLTETDDNTVVSLKKGDVVNLTLPNYGDGGYVWAVIQYDDHLLHQTDMFTWGSSGMLGDFGKDTWLFTALDIGSTALELRCQRPFGEQDVCQTFNVTFNIL